MNISPAIKIASNLHQLKRKRWSEVAYQSADFGELRWFWHLSPQDQMVLHAAKDMKDPLIFVMQKRIGPSDYRLYAMTSLEFERGKRPGAE